MRVLDIVNDNIVLFVLNYIIVNNFAISQMASLFFFYACMMGVLLPFLELSESCNLEICGT